MPEEMDNGPADQGEATPKAEPAPEATSAASPPASSAEAAAKTSDAGGSKPDPATRDDRSARRPRGEKRGGRSRDRSRGSRDKREPDEREAPEFQETLIDVYRCSATVKGGRRLSFGATVAVGDMNGRVAVGYGKAREVPGAIQKAMQQGRKDLKRFPIVGEGTIPHQVTGRFGASRVVLVPARPGTGLIANAATKAILEAGGLSNVLTKSFGSNNTRNLAKAVMQALASLRNREEVERLRGVSLEQKSS